MTGIVATMRLMMNLSMARFSYCSARSSRHRGRAATISRSRHSRPRAKGSYGAPPRRRLSNRPFTAGQSRRQLSRACSCGGDAHAFGARVEHVCKRLAQDSATGTRLDGLGREMTAEGACARHRAEQPKEMTGDRVQARYPARPRDFPERLSPESRRARTAPAAEVGAKPQRSAEKTRGRTGSGRS